MRIRSLNDSEKKAINVALNAYVRCASELDDKAVAWAVVVMLEQRFVDNLMWIENYRKEEK